MMIRPALVLLALGALATPAQALKMSVWDRELQTKLGDGESVGSVFTARLVTDYQGPVVILFALTDDEKARGTYTALKTRYDGVMEGGQLSVQPGAAANTALTLMKFLTAYKLKLNLQPAGESLSLPGLKTTATPATLPLPSQAPARQTK